MTKTIVVDDKFATMWCYPSKRIVHHKFHRFCSGEDFRDVMTKGAEAFEAHSCTKWLSDDRKVGLVPREDVEWGRHHWTPRVIKAGWKYFAMILPEKAVGQVYHSSLVDEFSEMGLIAKIFSTPKEGMAWLDSQGVADR